MTYEEALDYIHSTSWKGSRPGLARITELLSRLGNPERGLRVIHVAGTNGKGSVCAMLEAVLLHAGYRVGTFTSPYLTDFTERIRLNGVSISRADLSRTTEEVRPHAEAMDDTPTEFELITAIGFRFFARERVDVAIVECGMGGRLDSTNVIASPLLSIITGISLDHTEYLGDTIEKIAHEKAGIIKPGCPVVYGGAPGGAEEVIASRAAQLGCPYARVAHEKVAGVHPMAGGLAFHYLPYRGFFVPLLGVYQPHNAATVIEASFFLRERGLTLRREDLFDGLARTRWKGRFEPLSRRPEFFFDGGHNPEGVRAAAQTSRFLFFREKILLVAGMLADKDTARMVEEMSEIALAVYPICPDSPRALPARDLSKMFRARGIPVELYPSCDEAVAAAYREGERTGVPVLALGSLYSYAQIRRAVDRAREREEARRHVFGRGGE